MCGRFAVFSSVQDILAYQDFLEAVEEHAPSYNVAPGQHSLVATLENDGLRLRSMRWGLVPHWSREEKIGARLINARSETAQQKPAFRDAFAHRRCLVLANGFYEWSRSTRQPWFIRPEGRDIFAFAGLWERWAHGDDPLETFTILTTTPNEFAARIHDRMPVILPQVRELDWLAHGPSALLTPYPAAMEGWEVSKRVNRVANNGPDLIERIEGQSELPF